PVIALPKFPCGMNSLFCLTTCLFLSGFRAGANGDAFKATSSRHFINKFIVPAKTLKRGED
ncbi:MAG TPA: hypothetical protein VFB55_05750, partial [Verrucomicrobiae bacterium]|nr:hypothetical protein [Verrucomicrobiae bacterium]